MTVLSDRVDALEATNANLVTVLSGLQGTLQNAVDAGQGPQGWSPVLTVQSDGARRVLQVTDWVGGGSGATKPDTGDYVGSTGLEPLIGDAIDIRGAAGADGADGDGWTGATYDAGTGVVTFASADGLGFSTGDLRGADGDGFTGGSYDGGSGIITFTSDDGLGFSTGDVRGADGATWLTGTGVPSSGLGDDGDLYLDTATGDYYEKAAGSWSQTGNLKGDKGDTGDGFTGGSYDAGDGTVTFTSDDGLGFSTGDLRGADGADGAKWFSGTGAPSSGLGSNGDFYLDDANGDVYEKATGSWSVVDNLTGPAGADGAGSGTVTSVDITGGAGIDSSGGPITTSGAITVALDAATQASLAKVDHISVTQAVDLDAIETRVNELDASVVLKGTWDASVGTFPGGGTAQAGESWIVSVGGTVNGEVFTANDRIVAVSDNASTTLYSDWHKLDYTDAVLSVAGKTGAVTLTKADLTDFNEADYATGAEGDLAATATQPGDLATVATTGAYSDLSGKPTIPVSGTDFVDKSGGTFTGVVQFDDGLREPAVAMPANDIDMANGGVQTKTLGANTTFTESLADGDSVLLHLADGDTYTVTWPTMTWVGGSAPTLTADDVIVIWQRDTTVYGQYVGSVA